MNLTASSTPTIPQLTDRLAGHRTVGGAPRTELEWLAAHGTFVHYEADEVVLARPRPPD